MAQPTFATPRLLIRPAHAEDLAALHALWAEADVRRFLFDDEPVSRERARSVLALHLAEGAQGLGIWVVSARDDDTFLGCVGLYPITFAAQFEPALAGLLEPLAAFLPAYWGRGYAREAVAVLLEYAFGGLEQQVVAGVTDVPNHASDRMLRTLGFEVLSEAEGPHYRQRSYLLDRARWLARAKATRDPG